MGNKTTGGDEKFRRLRSNVQVIFFAVQSALCVSGAQGTMSKDFRLARKGVHTAFPHGRRHSCLGYVPKPCILLFFMRRSVRVCLWSTQGLQTCTVYVVKHSTLHIQWCTYHYTISALMLCTLVLKVSLLGIAISDEITQASCNKKRV